MKIAFLSLNKTFCRFIVEELSKHHTVKIWNRNANERINWTSILKLLEWCDVAYLEWLQTENLEISQITELGKPLVAFCHGIDAFNHSFMNWNNVAGLIIQDSHYPVLTKLRKDWDKFYPDKPLAKLPKKILIKSLGVDLKTFTPLPKPIPQYHIVTHATFIRPTKRIYEALQQFYDLIQLDDEKPWKMTLIGAWTPPGWLLDATEQDDYLFACGNLLDRLNFPPGRVALKTQNFPVETWAQFAKTADLYWCTSWRESFGLSMAEVCASGGYPLVNHYAGAEKVYPKKYLCKTSGEMVKKTIEWGNLSLEEKIKERETIRKHIEQYDGRKAAKDIRIFIEEVAQSFRK